MSYSTIRGDVPPQLALPDFIRLIWIFKNDLDAELFVRLG